jgi:DNA-binding PadR family transcriptional regulator
MKGTYLGELEELVLITVASLENNAYGVTILNQMASLAGREVNISAIHAVLRRLEAKGMLKSRMGGATAERGGRSKRYFNLTAAGKRTVEANIALRVQLYNKVPGLSVKLS